MEIARNNLAAKQRGYTLSAYEGRSTDVDGTQLERLKSSVTKYKAEIKALKEENGRLREELKLLGAKGKLKRTATPSPVRGKAKRATPTQSLTG